MASKVQKTHGSARKSVTTGSRRNFDRDNYRDDERGSFRTSPVDYDQYDDRVNRERELYSQGRRAMDDRSPSEGRRSASSRYENPQRDRQDYETPRGYGMGEHRYWSPNEDLDYRESEAPRGNRMRKESARSDRGFEHDDYEDSNYSSARVLRGRDEDENDEFEGRTTPIRIRNERDADEDLDDADYLPRRSRNMRQGFSEDMNFESSDEQSRRGRSTGRRSGSQSRSSHR